jgi:cell division protein FtsL
MGKSTLKEFFMKNKKTVLMLILIVAMAVSVYAQQYDSARDFEINWDENVKDGVVITG